MRYFRLGWVALIVCLVLGLVACTPPVPEPPTRTTLRKALPSADWILLQRPNSGWAAGAIVDIKDPDTLAGDPQFAGSFPELCKVPSEVWAPPEWTGGGFKLVGEYDYDIDVGGTLKLSTVDAAKAQVRLNDSAKRVIDIRKSQETPVPYERLIHWLTATNPEGMTNFELMPGRCQIYLLGDQFRIIGNIFVVHDGAIYSESRFGEPGEPLIEFESPEIFEKVVDVNAQFDPKYLKQGIFKVDETDPPLVVALRELDVAAALRSDPRIDRLIYAQGQFGLSLGSARPPLKDLLVKEGIAFK